MRNFFGSFLFTVIISSAFFFNCTSMSSQIKIKLIELEVEKTRHAEMTEYQKKLLISAKKWVKALQKIKELCPHVKTLFQNEMGLEGDVPTNTSHDTKLITEMNFFHNGESKKYKQCKKMERTCKRNTFQWDKQNFLTYNALKDTPYCNSSAHRVQCGLDLSDKTSQCADWRKECYTNGLELGRCLNVTFKCIEYGDETTVSIEAPIKRLSDNIEGYKNRCTIQLMAHLRENDLSLEKFFEKKYEFHMNEGQKIAMLMLEHIYPHFNSEDRLRFSYETPVINDMATLYEKRIELPMTCADESEKKSIENALKKIRATHTKTIKNLSGYMAWLKDEFDRNKQGISDGQKLFSILSVDEQGLKNSLNLLGPKLYGKVYSKKATTGTETKPCQHAVNPLLDEVRKMNGVREWFTQQIKKSGALQPEVAKAVMPKKSPKTKNGDPNKNKNTKKPSNLKRYLRQIPFGG